MFFSWRKRGGIALAHCFELYDIAVYTAIVLYIEENFFPKSYFGKDSFLIVFGIFALRFLARPIGGLVVGAYADRHGRKKALIFTSSLTGLATFIMACLPTFYQIGMAAPILFFMMQLLQSFSFGGENPTSAVYLMENVPENEKARTGAILWGTSLFAVAISAGVVAITKFSLTTDQMFEFGWRIPLLIGLINLMFSFWFRLKLLESTTTKRAQHLNIHWPSALKIFLMTAPSCLLFYINSVLSGHITKNFELNETLNSMFPIILNCFFYFMTLMSGYFIDKYSNCHAALKKNYLVMMILSVPIYALQGLGSPIMLIISEILIAFFIGICLASGPAVMSSHVEGKHKVTTFGVGFNISAVFFAGCAPFMLNYLSQYGPAFVGLLMSFGGICYFIALGLDKYLQSQHKVTV